MVCAVPAAVRGAERRLLELQQIGEVARFGYLSLHVCDSLSADRGPSLRDQRVERTDGDSLNDGVAEGSRLGWADPHRNTGQLRGLRTSNEIRARREQDHVVGVSFHRIR